MKQVDVNEILGMVFGRLTVLRHTRIKYTGASKARRYMYECSCSCGNMTEVSRLALITGNTTSCSCYLLERRMASLTKHMESDTKSNDYKGSREYKTWQNIKSRCFLPNNPAYKNYGGRGIVMDPEWRSSYAAFLSHVGRSPSNTHTLDRIDNDKGYFPGNVRWATRKEQCNNCRSNRILDFNGEKMTVSQWADLVGLPQKTIRSRLKYGWTIEQALRTPVGGKRISY